MENNTDKLKAYMDNLEEEIIKALPHIKSRKVVNNLKKAISLYERGKKEFK